MINITVQAVICTSEYVLRFKAKDYTLMTKEQNNLKILTEEKNINEASKQT